MSFCLLAGWKDIAQLLTVTVIFVIVLFLTFFTSRIVGRLEQQKMQGRNIRILETCRIGQTKYIQLIRVGSKVLAVAVSKDGVTMLSEIPEEGLDLSEESVPAGGAVFQNLLEKAKKRISGGNGET